MQSELIGKVLLNQYRVDRLIASTSMSDVYLTWDLHRNVYLVMKVLNAELLEEYPLNPETLQARSAGTKEVNDTPI